MIRTHFCEEAVNLTRRACCQLVLLLNDSARVPPCHPDLFLPDGNLTERLLKYETPVYVSEPPAVVEDHATFFLGIFLLILIASACTFTLNRITKPKLSIGYGSVGNLDIMMWMPAVRTPRRSSILVLLQGMACRRSSNRNNNNIIDNANNNISVVSSQVRMLPSYQSATSATSSLLAPPPYYENNNDSIA